MLRQHAHCKVVAGPPCMLAGVLELAVSLEELDALAPIPCFPCHAVGQWQALQGVSQCGHPHGHPALPLLCWLG